MVLDYTRSIEPDELAQRAMTAAIHAGRYAEENDIFRATMWAQLAVAWTQLLAHRTGHMAQQGPPGILTDEERRWPWKSAAPKEGR